MEVANLCICISVISWKFKTWEISLNENHEDVLMWKGRKKIIVFIDCFLEEFRWFSISACIFNQIEVRKCFLLQRQISFFRVGKEKFLLLDTYSFYCSLIFTFLESANWNGMFVPKPKQKVMLFYFSLALWWRIYSFIWRIISDVGIGDRYWLELNLETKNFIVIRLTSAVRHIELLFHMFLSFSYLFGD